MLKSVETKNRIVDNSVRIKKQEEKCLERMIFFSFFFCMERSNDIKTIASL